MKKKSGYLPSLDGWRALAIAGVLMAHDTPWVIGGHSNAQWRDDGGWGVELFFAISGILITWRILEDEAASGTFRVREFYLRRLFRIQPAAFAYLAVILLLMLAGVVHDWWRFWFGALFLYQNYLFHDQTSLMGVFTGHFWTLAVEEHFYLLLSLFFLLVRRYRVLAMCGLFLLLHAGQKIAYAHGLYADDSSPRRTFWIIGFLLWPTLMAMVLRIPRVLEGAKQYLQPWVAFLATLTMMYLLHVKRQGVHGFWSAGTLLSELGPLFLCVTFWVIATMLHPESWTTRVLEWKPLRYVGRISYSLYLWHVLFYVSVTQRAGITWAPLVAISGRPWRYLAAFGAAALSYHFIEKPMIRLGHRLAPPATPGHRDLAERTDLGLQDVQVSA